jgi:hypothetical protein
MYIVCECEIWYFKMDLRDIGWDGIDWIDLAEDRVQWGVLVKTAMNLRVP